MKVLLSAYACEPNRGSEPGVGWHWAIEIARLDHEVHVVTRANNRPVIEAARGALADAGKLQFHYYDLPPWLRRWKKGQRGVHLYYLLWQWGAYRLARELHARERFDRVHHITFVSAHQPSFMGNLGIPFTFGPVAGGETAPWRLRFGFGPRGWMIDALRDVLNYLGRCDPLMRRTFDQAERIYVTSAQTMALVPRRQRVKTTIQLAIGIESAGVATPGVERHEPTSISRSGLRILYVGRLLYWKGMHLGLPAFAGLLRSHPDARLTLVGQGPEERRWRKLARRLGIADALEWVPWLDREALAAHYETHDVLLFPSLRDSGGMVVLEAMAHGLPVVCLDLGGPAELVDATSGRVAVTADRSQAEISAAVACALIQLAENHGLCCRLNSGAIRRVQKFKWDAAVAAVYSQQPPSTPVSLAAADQV